MFLQRLSGIRTIVVISIFLATLLPTSVVFKAQGQQADSKQLLIQTYRTLYSYKTENGEFPSTAGKIKKVTEMEELKPYFKHKDQLNAKENSSLYIKSEMGQFNIILQKKLINGRFDVQAMDSNKTFCHSLDGINNRNQNCLISFKIASFG